MHVDFTEPARADLFEIALKIAERSPIIAHRFVDKLEVRANNIVHLPHAGAPRPQWGEGVRIVILGKYLIIHRVREDAVQILRVLHGARDIDALLAEEPLPE
jgi:toxin ParE1/3/4